MKTFRLCALLGMMAALTGCLEVEQHPNWVKGQYAGKKDNRPFEVRFHKDRLAWWGTVANRNMHQNEYNRANP
jgi:hypothetical protein